MKETFTKYEVMSEKTQVIRSIKNWEANSSSNFGLWGKLSLQYIDFGKFCILFRENIVFGSKSDDITIFTFGWNV